MLCVCVCVNLKWIYALEIYYYRSPFRYSFLDCRPFVTTMQIQAKTCIFLYKPSKYMSSEQTFAHFTLQFEVSDQVRSRLTSILHLPGLSHATQCSQSCSYPCATCMNKPSFKRYVNSDSYVMWDISFLYLSKRHELHQRKRKKQKYVELSFANG